MKVGEKECDASGEHWLMPTPRKTHKEMGNNAACCTLSWFIGVEIHVSGSCLRFILRIFTIHFLSFNYA